MEKAQDCLDESDVKSFLEALPFIKEYAINLVSFFQAMSRSSCHLMKGSPGQRHFFLHLLSVLPVTSLPFRRAYPSCRRVGQWRPWTLQSR
jgi:hypothetical protein